MRIAIPHRRLAFADAPLSPSAPVLDWRLTASDVRGFATTYLASFAAVLAFIV